MVHDSSASAAQRIVARFGPMLPRSKRKDISSSRIHILPPGEAWRKAYLDAEANWIGTNPERRKEAERESAIVEGFVPADHSGVYIRADHGGISNVELHESLHFYTSHNFEDTVSWSVKEATTEYFARDMQGWPDSERGVVYEEGQPLLDAWVARDPRRKDALARAYFGGDFREVTRLDPDFMTRVRPGGAWERILQTVEKMRAR